MNNIRFSLMKWIRKLLLPVVPIYYIVTKVRNILFDKNIFKSKSYEIPLICVGNLSVGGTGKSPMIEYLIRLLKADYQIATLSRGYKRESEGFQLADDNATALTLGDEPYQFYKKFRDVYVSVDNDRQHGISKLLSLPKPPEVILLDDAYQHRKVKAGFNILLTTYDKLYAEDIVLPTGDLREPRSGANRANAIIVTKCPDDLKASEQNRIIEKLKPNKGQNVFFSKISYEDSVFSKTHKIALSNLNSQKITLVTGIAKPEPLLEYLKDEGITYEHLKFKDHHTFSKDEIDELKEKEFVLTTEKDFVRLKHELKDDKLYYLPIRASIFESELLNDSVKDYVKNSTK